MQIIFTLPQFLGPTPVPNIWVWHRFSILLWLLWTKRLYQALRSRNSRLSSVTPSKVLYTSFLPLASCAAYLLQSPPLSSIHHCAQPALSNFKRKLEKHHHMSKHTHTHFVLWAYPATQLPSPTLSSNPGPNISLAYTFLSLL